MRKRILAVLSASALIALVAGATPQTTAAATSPKLTYDYVISLTGNADMSRAAANQSCNKPYSNDLQDALDDYDNGDTIYLCPGVYTGQFGQLRDTNLILIGANPATTIIDGRQGIPTGYPALSITTDGLLSIKNLTIRNSASDFDGGGVYTDEDLECSNSTFKNNSVDAYSNGGAIYAGGDVSLKGCTFTNNSAGDSGGAIYADGDTYCLNSTFTGNSADTNDDGTGLGGAIYGDQDIESRKCTYKSNFAAQGGALYAYYNIADFDGVYTSNSAASNGGAIYSYDDGGDTDYLTRSKFTSNFTLYNADGGSDGSGGAVFSEATFLKITGAKFFKNYSASQGGAIASMGVMNVYKSTFTQNESYIDGGAIATIYPSLGDVHIWSGNIFTKNRSGQLGGAIYSDDGLYIESANNVFSGNFATDRASYGAAEYRNDGGFARCTIEELLPDAVAGYWFEDVFIEGSQSFFESDSVC